MLVHDRAHGPVEFARADADLAFGPDGFGLGQQLADTLVFGRRHVEHRHVGTHAQFLGNVLAQILHVFLRHKVGLVDRDQKWFALAVQKVNQPLVLHTDAACGVDDHNGHIGPLGAGKGLADAVLLHAVGDAGALANAGRVHELVAFLAAYNGHIHGVAGGAGDVADDQALFAQQGV